MPQDEFPTSFAALSEARRAQATLKSLFTFAQETGFLRFNEGKQTFCTK